MKLKNIFISGLSLLALSACDDYLDVDAPSKFFPKDIYSSVKDAGMALNGVYAEMLGSNTFGQAYTYDLILNSDVDFVSNSNETAQTNTPKRYDQTSASSKANSVWNATYSGIETANSFIYYLEHSDIYNENNDDYSTLVQYMGEAKVIRAMFYYELMCYWGDVPFTLEPTSTSNNFAPAITSRDVIARKLMEDLIAIAPNMKPAAQLAEGIERVSQEACWAMIARIGLQAAGYSLRHADNDDTSYGYMGKPSAAEETWFLTTTREYAGKVIESGTHSLNNSYQDVFLNECNFTVVNNDDPIFELPFSIESSGYIGYRQGPKFASNGGSTNYQWGECGGNQQLEAFYRYSFKPGDMRRDAIVGWWQYTYDGIPKINNGYSMYNNKWSKMFNTTNAFSKISTGNTGINYPYLRYADVLLMWAEADYKLTGTASTDAINYVQQVRNRAYKGSSVSAPQVVGSADTFLDEILQERKWEFAGENMRWKDLVRNNKLAETIYFTFFRYYAIAGYMGGNDDSDLDKVIADYDGIDYFGIGDDVYTQEEIDAAIPGDLAYGRTAGKGKNSLLPGTLYYTWIQNPKDNSYFANKELPTLYIYNPYGEAVSMPRDSISTARKFFNELYNKYQGKTKAANYKPIPNPENPQATIDANSWTTASFYEWMNADGTMKNQVLYSFYGYIHGGQIDKDNIYIVRDGKEEQLDIRTVTTTPANLPAVRYLLPIPREAITRSEGVYKNYYGY